MAKSDEKIEVVTNETVEKLRTRLAELCLKKIDELNSMRVQNPEAIMNALATVFNSIK